MRYQKGNTLLLELVVVILFFALSQAIVLQVFAKAQTLNREAQVTNLAVMRAEDAAETLAVSDDAEGTLLALGFTATDDGYLCTSGDGYRLVATLSRFTQPSGELTTVEIHAYRGATELFTLPAVRYREVSVQ